MGRFRQGAARFRFTFALPAAGVYRRDKKSDLGASRQERKRRWMFRRLRELLSSGAVPNVS